MSNGVLDGLDSIKIPARKNRASIQSAKEDKALAYQIGDTFNLELDKISTEAQVRTNFDEDRLLEFASQLVSEGQRNPMEVASLGNDKYLLITGERRYRALMLNSSKMGKVTLIAMPEDAKQRIALQLTENLQREDLGALELAAALKKLVELGLSQKNIADILGKGKDWVSRYLALSDLPSYIESLLEGDYTKDIRLILTLQKIDEINQSVAEKLSEQVQKGLVGRQNVNDVYQRLKDGVPEKASHSVSEEDIKGVHYDKKNLSIQPQEFNAIVEARLINGEKVKGILSTDRVAEDEDWCWIELEGGDKVCVEVNKIRIRAVSK